jgi:hypothetical protein
MPRITMQHNRLAVQQQLIALRRELPPAEALVSIVH